METRFNLWLDDNRDIKDYLYQDGSLIDISTGNLIYPIINNGLEWKWAKTNQEAIELLKTGLVEIASFDHDLGIIDGKIYEAKPTIYFLAEESFNGNNYWPKRCLVHSMNSVGKKWISGMIERYGPYNK